MMVTSTMLNIITTFVHIKKLKGLTAEVINYIVVCKNAKESLSSYIVRIKNPCLKSEHLQ